MKEILTINGKRHRLRDHTPLLQSSWASTMNAIREDPAAPRWNSHYGDRLDWEGLEAVRRFGDELDSLRDPVQWDRGRPADRIMERLAREVPATPGLAEKIPGGVQSLRAWQDIQPTARGDLAAGMERFVPATADLAGFITYRTAGTTGHPLTIPHHPRAACAYEPLASFVLDRFGIDHRFGPGMNATFLVGYQAYTVTCATVVTSWNGAGFAKLNLHPADWPDPDAPRRFFNNQRPFFVSGDPVALACMMESGIDHKPAAIFSTALALAPALREKLAGYYRCPVIDWYSLNETGPIGCTCGEQDGFHILPHDIYVEIFDDAGKPVPPGTRGEIAVTGGRNPYLPLLRYRTGDTAVLDTSPCPCGDPMPRLRDLDGRKPVVFRDAAGMPVNSVDISRLLRPFPCLQHRFVQHRDGSCTLTLRPLPGSEPDTAGMRRELAKLFGSLDIAVVTDPGLGDHVPGGKVEPFVSEIEGL